jgi:transposase
MKEGGPPGIIEHGVAYVGLAQNFTQEDRPMLYLALDQHSKQLTVNLRDEAGEIRLRRQVSTKRKGMEEFGQQLAAFQEPYVAIVEVCGFNDWLLEWLPQHGCQEIVLVQPDRRSKKKTDRRDANALGELLWINRQRLLGGQRPHGLRRVYIPTARDKEDRQLTALRQVATGRKTRCVNRVHHLLRRHNLEQDCPTKGIQSLKARKWLRQLSLSPLDRLEMNQLLDQWELCEKQLAELDTWIVERCAQSKSAQRLVHLCGLGNYSALGLAARIGEVSRFQRPRSLVNYFGLAPGCRNSGETTQRLGSITKEGSAFARYLLGQMVLHLLRKDAWMRAWYLRIKKRRGSKIARVAVMRRMTTIIWHMLTHDEPYQPGGGGRTRKRRQAQSVQPA